MLKIMRQPERRRDDDYLYDYCKDKVLVVYDGKVWKSIGALISAYGVSARYSVDYRRGELGETVQEAVDHFLSIGKAFAPKPALEYKNLAVRYRGDFYRSWASVALHHGFTRGQFNGMKMKYGGDGRKAVEALVGPDFEPDYDRNYDPDFKPAA